MIRGHHRQGPLLRPGYAAADLGVRTSRRISWPPGGRGGDDPEETQREFRSSFQAFKRPTLPQVEHLLRLGRPRPVGNDRLAAARALTPPTRSKDEVRRSKGKKWIGFPNRRQKI